jgi:hypothetical protein
MSVFSTAVNGFRSTMSRAGKMYNSLPSQVALRNSKYLAYAPKIGLIGAGAGLAIGAASGNSRDRNHTSRAAMGAGIGALAGASLWRNNGGSVIRGLLR